MRSISRFSLPTLSLPGDPIDAGPEMILGPVRLFSRATQIIIDAMKKANVRRLICVTGFPACPEDRIGSGQS